MAGARGLAASIFLATVVQWPDSMPARNSLPAPGLYELIARLELPHLERWAIDHATTVCLPASQSNSEIPIPVVSANNPFGQCAAANFVGDDKSLQYDIVCHERGAAKGHAMYSVSLDTFSGRVAMIMGAKNMTMTEVQRARRIGDCDDAH
jgi:uncharacterized protein DUF3617